MAGSEDHPELEFCCNLHDSDGAGFEKLPVEAAKRREVDAGVTRKRPFGEVNDVSASLPRSSHLADDVTRIPFNVGVNGELACSHA